MFPRPTFFTDHCRRRRPPFPSQRHVLKQEEVTGAGNSALAELNARLDAVGAGVQERAGALDGGTQVQGIQAAIRRLRAELGGMDLRVGVLQQQLLAKQHRTQVSAQEEEGEGE